jgi:hypothetical protein
MSKKGIKVTVFTRPLLRLTDRASTVDFSFSRGAVRGVLTGKPQSEKDVMMRIRRLKNKLSF